MPGAGLARWRAAYVVSPLDASTGHGVSWARRLVDTGGDEQAAAHPARRRLGKLLRSARRRARVAGRDARRSRRRCPVAAEAMSAAPHDSSSLGKRLAGAVRQDCSRARAPDDVGRCKTRAVHPTALPSRRGACQDLRDRGIWPALALDLACSTARATAHAWRSGCVDAAWSIGDGITAGCSGQTDPKWLCDELARGGAAMDLPASRRGRLVAGRTS